MDNKTSLSRFTPVHQKWINCVLLYLGITYLSEISTIDGTSLINGINDGDEENMQYRNLLTCPVQVKPNTWSWALWDIHLQSYTTMNSSDLKVPLGNWTSNHSTNGRWNAYQDQILVYSWVNDNNNWKKYRVYGEFLIQSCQRVANIGYNKMTPVQIDTTYSDVFVQYSARFTPSKGLKVY